MYGRYKHIRDAAIRRCALPTEGLKPRKALCARRWGEFIERLSCNFFFYNDHTFRPGIATATSVPTPRQMGSSPACERTPAGILE